MKLLEKHFEIALETPDGITRLRELILKFALQGKLVPQNEKEESATILLQKIKMQKQKLINQGKLKLQKELEKVKEIEFPFMLPKGWVFERLNNVVDVRDGTHNSPKDALGLNTYPLITSKNFINGIIDFENARRISEEDHFEISKRSKVEKDDILFSMIGGNLGNQVMVLDNREFSIKNLALIKYYSRDLTLPEFIKKFTEYLAIDIQMKAKGGAQPFVGLGELRNLVIGLPPIEEQKRIVEKIEQLILLCDQLEKQRDIKNQSVSKINNAAINKLLTSTNGISFKEATCFINDNFNELYSTTSAVDELRRAILSLGVCGKFEIDSKKSIHSKKYPTIPTNEEPFKLPENWIWTKLENLGETQTGTTPPKKNPEFYGDYIPFLGPGDIKDFKINYTNEGLSKLGIEKARFIARNSILMVCIGGSIGKMAINDRDVTCNQQINTITPYEGVHLNYLSAVLQSEYFQNKILLSSGGSATPIINKGKWISIPIPLPPLDIQIEISNKIENLLNLCRTLEDSISKVSIKQTQILNSVLAIS
jgi:type I restriction enzyme S subunit